MKKNIYLSIVSAVFLVLSFPNFNLAFLVWFALVPFFFLLDGKSPKAAFLWGWLTGFLFFLGTHYWLIHVTLPGMLLVNLYLGIYFGLFGLGYAYFVGNGRDRSLLFILPSLWVALEFTRDRLFTGFGWACLGHSQYQILPIIQIADITGVFGVSFLVVMVNVLLKDLFELPPLAGTGLAPSLKKEGKHFPGLVPIIKKVGDVPTYCVAAVIVAVLGYGVIQLKSYHRYAGSGFDVSVVQPNIPQSRKWDPDSWEGIQQKLYELTRSLDHPTSLVIWPETSFPGYLWQSPERYQELKKFVRDNKINLLFGAVTNRDGGYYNSAILLSSQGVEAGRYDKMHLVPFGEFLPLRPFLNFIENFVPIGDFERGRDPALFSQLFQDTSFAVLICFEDTVAPVVRRAVKKGSHFLVNITNDGWFQDTNEPFLHLQGAVFQSVAHRRYMIRSANTGVSALIRYNGEISAMIMDAKGKKVMVQGAKKFWPVKIERTLTFYTRFGDVFAYFCFCAVAAALIKRKILL